MNGNHASRRAPPPPLALPAKPKSYTSTDMVGFLREVADRFQLYVAAFDPSPQLQSDMDEVNQSLDLAARWIEETETHVSQLADDLADCRGAQLAAEQQAIGMEDHAAKLTERVQELEAAHHEASATLRDIQAESEELGKLRAEASALREENQALRAWKDQKLKSDSAARKREEQAAVAAAAEAARKAREQEVQQLKQALQASREECASFKQREGSLAERERRLERSTQAFLTDRARNAVVKNERPKIIALTTSEINKAVIKAGQDPMQVILGTDLAQVLDLADAGLKFAPTRELLALAQKYTGLSGDIDPSHVAGMLRAVWEDARLTFHKIALHIEEISHRLSAAEQIKIQLQQREAALRQATEAMKTVQGDVDSLLGLLGTK